MDGITVIDHPLVARHLTALRDRRTSSAVFRQGLSDVSMLLLYEALRGLRLRDEPVETPLEQANGPRLADDIVVVAILRAGLGMTDGALRLLPEMRIGHLGMFRDDTALRPVGYYESIPALRPEGQVVVVDPMVATGSSAVAALTRLRELGASRLTLVCLLAAPEGLRRLRAAHPDVPVTCAAIDERLDERGYIRPGLGDAGDRIFGTEDRGVSEPAQSS